MISTTIFVLSLLFSGLLAFVIGFVIGCVAADAAQKDKK